jgi:hypothetical protein
MTRPAGLNRLLDKVITEIIASPVLPLAPLTPGIPTPALALARKPTWSLEARGPDLISEVAEPFCVRSGDQSTKRGLAHVKQLRNLCLGFLTRINHPNGCCLLRLG